MLERKVEIVIDAEYSFEGDFLIPQPLEDKNFMEANTFTSSVSQKDPWKKKHF